MKTFTFGVWAFGFAILHYLGNKYPSGRFLAYEKDEKIFHSLINTRKHPYFFQEYSLPDNIVLTNDIRTWLLESDSLILAIPNQFIRSLILEIQPYITNKHSFINLSKWIDNTTLSTVSDTLVTTLKIDNMRYAVLSGWMIAQEVLSWCSIWADIATTDISWWIELKNFFESDTLSIELTDQYKNVELVGALKNILALLIWYQEWKWSVWSSLWMYLVKWYSEIQSLMKLLWGSNDFDFNHYSSWGDIIATCFWNSRNRYLWNLVGSGMLLHEALNKMKDEKKTAEGYYTLKAILWYIDESENFPLLSEIGKIFFQDSILERN